MRSRVHWFGLLVVAALACRDSGEPPLVDPEILESVAESNQVAMGVEHYITADGIRRAHVRADTAFFLKDSPVIQLRIMQVTFFDNLGDTTSVLTALQGDYNWSTGDMTARDEVVVVNPKEGRRVETSVLFYNRVEDRIWGDAYTRMVEADGTVIEGTAFETNSSMDQIELTSARLVRQPGSQPQEP
jgi:LPS export ABC transporter protein LptC